MKQSELDLALSNAIYERNKKAAKRALKKGANPNAVMTVVGGSKTLEGRMMTLLTQAVSTNDIGMIRLLLRYGADTECAATYDLTALHYAAAFGFVDCCECLLDAGADLHAQDCNGLTPRQVALMAGHPDVYHYLLGQEVADDPQFPEDILEALGVLAS